MPDALEWKQMFRLDGKVAVVTGGQSALPRSRCFYWQLLMAS